MDLILWRHCEAEPGAPDMGRRLTPKGLKQAARMAPFLERHLPDTCRILVSPADRAQQTAQVGAAVEFTAYMEEMKRTSKIKRNGKLFATE